MEDDRVPMEIRGEIATFLKDLLADEPARKPVAKA